MIVIIALAIVFAVSTIMMLIPARKPVVAVYAVNRDFVASSHFCHSCRVRHTTTECPNQ